MGFNDQTFDENSEIKLSVLVSNHNQTGKWYKDGILIEPNKLTKIEVNTKNDRFGFKPKHKNFEYLFY